MTSSGARTGLAARSVAAAGLGTLGRPRNSGDNSLRAVSAARTLCIESSIHTVSSTHTPSVPSWHSRSTCTLRRPRYRVAPPSVPSWHSRSTCTRRRRGGLPARQSGSGQPKPGWRRRRRPGTRTESRGLGFPACVTSGFAAAAAAARRARWRPVQARLRHRASRPRRGAISGGPGAHVTAQPRPPARRAGAPTNDAAAGPAKPSPFRPTTPLSLVTVPASALHIAVARSARVSVARCERSRAASSAAAFHPPLACRRRPSSQPKRAAGLPEAPDARSRSPSAPRPGGPAEFRFAGSEAWPDGSCGGQQRQPPPGARSVRQVTPRPPIPVAVRQGPGSCLRRPANTISPPPRAQQCFGSARSWPGQRIGQAEGCCGERSLTPGATQSSRMASQLMSCVCVLEGMRQ